MESLLLAIRARSGPVRANPQLDVKFCGIPRGGDYAGEKQGFVTIHSRAAMELTHLSVVLKIESAIGDRFVSIYVPTLPPGGGARFEPVSLSGVALTGDLNYIGGQPEIKGVRYAAWCAQFRAEAQQATIVTPHELVAEFWLQAVRPGTGYVSRGGKLLPEMSPSEFAATIRRDPTFRRKLESDRRFAITFRKLTPTRNGYSVELDLVDHEVKSKTTRYRGDFQLPPVTLGAHGEVAAANKLSLKVRSGAEEMTLGQVSLWNVMERQWATTGGPAHGRQFVPASEIPAADSPEAAAKDRLAAAMTLAREGKFDEARTALEKIVADYPGGQWETAAKLALSRLDAMKQGRDKAEELRKRLGVPRR
jgi:hypothetical protein